MIVVPQRSSAEASYAFGAGTSSIQSKLRSPGATIVGLVVSSIVKVAVYEEGLSQMSVAVNVTTTEPVAPQSSDNATKSLDHSKSLQLSTAVAPPLSSNHASNSAMLPKPSHSAV